MAYPEQKEGPRYFAVHPDVWKNPKGFRAVPISPATYSHGGVKIEKDA
jgi:hypothetical protein